MSEIDADFIASTISSMFRRCEAAKLVGGIASSDVVNGMAIPVGWKFDILTEYYIPPNVDLNTVSVFQ